MDQWISRIVIFGIFIILSRITSGQVLDVEYRQTVLFEQRTKTELTYDFILSKDRGLYFYTGGNSEILDVNFGQMEMDNDPGLVYFDKEYRNHTLIYNQPIINQIQFIRETMPLQEWKILDEWKKVGDYDCQKAITEFRGRNYEAWFTDRIPIPAGPWKFDGLPGLILEVKSLDGVLQIIVVKMVEIAEPEYPDIEEIKDEEVITWNEYVKRFRKVMRRIQKSLRANDDFETESSLGIDMIEVIDY